MDFFTSASSIKGIASYFFVSFFVSFIVLISIQVLFNKSNFRSRTGLKAASSRYIVMLVFAMSLLGTTVGITGGWSREGVVGDVIPAVLGVIGGLSVYLYGNQKSKALVVLPSVVAFTMTIYIGYFIGAEIRNPIERAKAYRDMCFATLSDSKILSSRESYCRFLTGAGEDCFFELFKNKMTYSSSARYGDEEYRLAWNIEEASKLEHELLQCNVLNEGQKKALIDYYN